MTMALTGIVTTDLAAITRGRWIPTARYEAGDTSGIGWLPANLALTAFGGIATPNPWGSTGDLRVVADRTARYRTAATGSETPFDIVMGDIVELDGSPWRCCPRTLLRDAATALQAETGLSLRMAVEQEFQIFGADFPAAHPLSVNALRRTDPFAPRLMEALDEAGVDPDVVLAEFGTDQFEVTCSPADPVTAADRAIAIREIVREIVGVRGWRASFAPKTAVDAVGNGVHIHFSLTDAEGRPAGFDAAQPGRLSGRGAAFCAGILRHLPALTMFSAPSVASYYRLRPQGWSASWTWLADRDREATLRICPTTTVGGGDPERQHNVEYRAADATANPYVAIAALIRAGLGGLADGLPPPPVVADHPDTLDTAACIALGLRRLPETLEDAVAAWQGDAAAYGWFAPDFSETWLSVRRDEMARLAALSPDETCRLYRDLY